MSGAPSGGASARATKWAEVAPEKGRARHDSLKQALLDAGAPAAVEFVACESGEAFAEALERAMAGAQAVRVADEFAVAAGSASESFPASMLTLRAADSIDLIAGRWWPKNRTAEGFARAAAHDLKIVDLAGGALVIGSGGAARAAVFALAKLGFERFHLVDRDDESSAALAGEMGRGFFRAAFECTRKNYVTQLPGVFTMVANASSTANQDLASELYHMNFLRPGACWVELFPGPADSPLLVEARGAGAEVELGSRVASLADAAWAVEALGAKIDVEAHGRRLQAAFESASASRADPGSNSV